MSFASAGSTRALVSGLAPVLVVVLVLFLVAGIEHSMKLLWN